ncbi:MAG: GNAT family N-acetyltransferase [Terriglobales bacterium]
MANTVSASLAEPIIAAAPTPRDVAAWTPSVEPLRFFLGGRDLGALQIPALTLNVPFTHLSTKLEDSAPPWEILPPGIEAAVVPAQPVDAEPQRLTLLPGLVRYVGVPSKRFFVDLRRTFAEYLHKFGAKQRYDMTRKPRKFAEFSGGQIQWRDFRSADELRAFARLANQISEKSWGARAGGHGFAGRMPDAELQKLTEQNLARGFVLFHRDRPVAYVFCCQQYEHLLYQHVAYDENYSRWSPGAVLLYLIVERLFDERRYKFLDLGEGTLGYKSFFSNRCIQCARILYFRRTVRNLAMVSSHFALCTASVAAGRALSRIGLKQRIKKQMMGKMRRPGQWTE